MKTVSLVLRAKSGQITSICHYQNDGSTSAHRRRFGIALRSIACRRTASSATPCRALVDGGRRSGSRHAHQPESTTRGFPHLAGGGWHLANLVVYPRHERAG